MYYIIIGNGYIGNYLNENIKGSNLWVDKIYTKTDIRELLTWYPDGVIINAAGTTGKPNVDWCEDHKAETILGNIHLPVMIAEVCAEMKRHWINIGSGCIYNGYEKNWTEDDEPNFNESFYSYTKKEGQRLVNELPYSCTLRIRMPIDPFMGDRCLVTKLLTYVNAGNPVMSDLTNSMTCLDDLANIIKIVGDNKLEGTYNAVNKGSLSATDILTLYKKYVYSTLTWKSETYDNLVSKGYIKAARSNCVLSTKKLESLYDVPHIVDRMFSILKGYAEITGACND